MAGKSISPMNKFFISFAALLSSGIFSYSYWREWLGIKYFQEEIMLQTGNPQAPYFHASEDLYVKVLLIFGILFGVIFLATLYFTIKGKWGIVFLCFTLAMLSILAVMVNGAIK
jgi:VIT1/CCC1 family predicted Fe2+/Mn2+ transporter